MRKYKEWKKKYESGDPELREEARADIHNTIEANKHSIALVTLGGIFVTGVILGVGGKSCFDKIFKTVVKNRTIDFSTFNPKAIKFTITGKNVFGKNITPYVGSFTIEEWVGSFLGSLADKTAGANITAEVFKQLPNMKALDPKALKDLGIEVSKF